MQSRLSINEAPIFGNSRYGLVQLSEDAIRTRPLRQRPCQTRKAVALPDEIEASQVLQYRAFEYRVQTCEDDRHRRYPPHAQPARSRSILNALSDRCSGVLTRPRSPVVRPRRRESEDLIGRSRPRRNSLTLRKTSLSPASSKPARTTLRHYRGRSSMGTNLASCLNIFFPQSPAHSHLRSCH